MSKPRYQVEATLNTLPRLNTSYLGLSSQLIGKDIFILESLSIDTGNLILYADIRFNDQTDRDAIGSYVLDRVSSNATTKNWFTRATLRSHLCTHDDSSISDCKTTSFLEFTK